MGEFFRKWRALSHRIASVLCVAFGAISLVAGWQLAQRNGWFWMPILFVVFGIGLIVLARFGRVRHSEP